ncbi:MAG: cell envelope integrity protein TolA [Pseudomonadota bacterium]
MTSAEPGRVAAAFLAFSVHALFFALMMFGLSWQKRTPETMMVDLWDSLPSIAEPVQEVQPAPPPQPAPQPAVREEIKVAKSAPAPSRADIELKDKKRRKEEERRAQEAAQLKAQQETQRLAALQAQQQALAEAARLQREQEEALVRLTTERATAGDRVKAEYKDRIMSKIRRYVVLPPDLSGNPQAEYRVTLLPGGDVMNAKLTRSSGNAAYDAAVERAIYKAQPLPLPPDPAMFSAFRELDLQFRPQQ